MGADDDEQEEREAERPEDREPASVKRVKRKPGDTLQVLLAEFRRRAKGLRDDDLHAEVELLVDRIVELNAASVPRPLRDEFRTMMQGMIEADPTFADIVARMRASVARESR